MSVENLLCVYIYHPVSSTLPLAPWFRGRPHCVLVGGSAYFQIQNLRGPDFLASCCGQARDRHGLRLDWSHSPGERWKEAGGSSLAGVPGQHHWKGCWLRWSLWQQLCMVLAVWSSWAVLVPTCFPHLFLQPLSNAMDPGSLISVACKQQSWQYGTPMQESYSKTGSHTNTHSPLHHSLL